MKIEVHARPLSEELVINCSVCEVPLIQGQFVLEVRRGDQLFILAELWGCCGTPFPLVCLFDSQEPAQEAGTRLLRNITRGVLFENLPLLSREIALTRYPLKFL